MKKLNFFLGIALVGFICSCKKQQVKVKTVPNLLVGTWNLQSQDIYIYVNGALQVGAAGTTTNSTKATLTFNGDGTDTATAVFGINGFLPLGANGSPGYNGNYSLADTTLNMNPFFIGSLYADTLLAPPSVISYSNKIITETATINTLTPSLLGFDTDIVILQTINYTKTRIITTKNSYTYSR